MKFPEHRWHAPLGDTEVRVVWWRPDAATQAQLEAGLPLLATGERTRMQRFHFEKDRRTFLASRILLRRTLGAIDGRRPDALTFTTDVHGEKPELVDTPTQRPLRFSLTHTEGLVACALAWTIDVGVDAEAHTRRPVSPGVVRRVLTPAERVALESMPPRDRERRFLTSWCVKEAYLKATGTGLRVAPDMVELDWQATDIPTISSDAANRWQVTVADAAPADTHVLALVHRRTAEPTRRVAIVEFRL